MKQEKSQPKQGSFLAVWKSSDGCIYADSYKWDGALYQFSIPHNQWFEYDDSVCYAFPVTYITDVDKGDYSEEEMERQRKEKESICDISF